MYRFIFASLVLAASFLLSQCSFTEAAAISRNNPYRSFNVTGVNYASMQWERKYGRQATKNWSHGHFSGRWFRRR